MRGQNGVNKNADKVKDIIHDVAIKINFIHSVHKLSVLQVHARIRR